MAAHHLVAGECDHCLPRHVSFHASKDWTQGCDYSQAGIVLWRCPVAGGSVMQADWPNFRMFKQHCVLSELAD